MIPSAELFSQVSRTILEAVDASEFPASFRAALKIPLTQQGKVLAQDGYPLWPALVLATCAASGGGVSAGIRVASAIEVFIAALDVLDEIEDDDISPTRDSVGMGQALNVSTALLLLAQRLLLGSIPADLSANQAEFARILVEAGLAATAGQHLDLATEGGADISLEDALAIARQKAGSLAGGACRLGAMLGTADDTLLSRYESFGRHYGIALQLANDLHDADNTQRKSDLHKQKGTLPLIYSRNSSPGQSEVPLDRVRNGALHFTWVVLELERQICADILIELAGDGQNIAGLQSLLAKAE